MNYCLKCGGALAAQLTAEQVPEVMLWIGSRISSDRLERAVRDKVKTGCVLFPKSGVAICSNADAPEEKRRKKRA